MTEPTTTTTDFKDGALYKALVTHLPVFAKKPFDTASDLDVQALKEATGKSHEAVYKWLRSSKLTPANAQALVKLANSDDNVRVLTALGRTPPTLQDFHSFVFA